MDGHSITYLTDLKKAIDNIAIDKIEKLRNIIQELIGSGRTFFICGNGGSAATSSHMACDLGKGILGKKPREKTKRLRAVSLNDCIPTMTAWGNDEGYDYIFSEQLKNLGKENDFLLVISASGNSKNIIEVLLTAKNMKIKTFALVGFDGGIVRDIVDDFLLVPVNDYGLVEDIHGIVNHLITDYFKKKSS